MFDFDLDWEYKTIDWGTIEAIGYCDVTINSWTWAPGIWAGIKDKKFIVCDDNGITKCIIDVTFVDLDKRKVWFKINEKFSYNMNIGDKLKLLEEKQMVAFLLYKKIHLSIAIPTGMLCDLGIAYIIAQVIRTF